MKLEDIILSGGADYTDLVRKAVADPDVYAAVNGALKSIFETHDPESCRRALEVGTHFGDRDFASVVAQTLVNDVQTNGQLPSWGVAAVDFVSTQLVPSDPLRDQVFKLALARSETRLQAWRMSRSHDASAVSEHVVELLAEHPQEAKAVGIKFALVWQPSCMELASYLHGVERTPAIETLLETLKMYLFRIRRVRLWREFELYLKRPKPT